MESFCIVPPSGGTILEEKKLEPLNSVRLRWWIRPQKAQRLWEGWVVSHAPSKASVPQAGRRGCTVVTTLLQRDAAAIYRAERIRRAQREWVVMLIAYGDDSADETKKRVFAAGAVVARQEDWDIFLSAWREKNPGERPFHAADCDSDQRNFKNRKHEENKKLYADNVRLFVNSPLIGAGVAISIPDYWDLFPFAPADKWWPYYMCFAGVLSCICQIAHLSIPLEDIKVVFDNSPEQELDSARIFDFIAHQPGALPCILEEGIQFGNHRKTPGLQVADLLAHETMKDLDNRIGPKQRWPRQSLIELQRSNRFAAVLYDRQKLEQHRIAADELHADAEKGRAFAAWLNNNEIRDSVHARLRFMAEHGIVGHEVDPLTDKL